MSIEQTVQTVIFFDLDATLVENRFSQRVMADVLSEIATQADVEARTLRRALIAENYRRQSENPDDVLTMDWDDIARTVAAQHGVQLSQSIDELWQRYADGEQVEVLDDAHAMLRRLQADHRRLVIATKGLSKYQRPVMAVTGLDELFDDLLAPDLTGYHKASPGYMADYKRRYPGALCIHVGDHYIDDVIAPLRNGFFSVLRAPRAELAAEPDPFARVALLDGVLEHIHAYPAESDARPHAVVTSLQEVPEIVSRLEAERVA